MNRLQRILLLTSVFILVAAGSGIAAWVVREGDGIYIEDRKGQQWDVTQAEQLGFVKQRICRNPHFRMDTT